MKTSLLIAGLSVSLLSAPLFAAETLAAAPAGRAEGAAREPATPIQAVAFTQVHLADAFWAPRLETNRTVTIPTCFKKCEETRIPNFRRAAKLEPGDFRGYPYDDSDVYKVMEGAAYCLATQKDPVLEKYLDDLIAVIAKAQEPDGYLYTPRTIHGAKAPGRASHVRWLNEMGGVNGQDSHELYSAGHMVEAAVAYYQTTGKRSFLDVAVKNANLVNQVWGPAPEQLKISPGHQEIELALVRLYQATNDRKYLTLAKFLLDCRGRYRRPGDKNGAFNEYYANLVPVTELKEAIGHSVRTGYMLSAMTDIASLLGDPAYAKAVDTIWGDTVGTKLYLHGGVGAIAGHEGFGAPYQLPNNGYNETCAAIAMCLWNERMFLLHGDAKYIDVLERTLYNGFLSGVSLSGDHFFYPNPLVSRGGYGRSAWFGCSCCPVNVCRFLPSVPGMVYAVRNDQLYVNLYAGGTAEAEVAGTKLGLKQETQYPWNGAIKLTLAPAKTTKFTVRLRIPGWACQQPLPTELYRYAEQEKPQVKLTVNGKPEKLVLDQGYAVITRKWKANDVVALDLEMPVRRVVADDRVKDDAGRVALERGPLMYCLEGIDNGGKIFPLVLPDDARLAIQPRPELLGGVTVISGQGQAARRQADGTVTTEPATLTAIPYYAWCNRGAGQMQVWLPRTVKTAQPLPPPTLAGDSQATASYCHSNDACEALNDGILPKDSCDQGIPRMTWWNHKGTTEWVQYEFAKPAKVGSALVWWFDDRRRNGGCRVPASVQVQWLDGQEWKPVAGQSAGGCEIDRANPITFTPVTTKTLRLQVKLQDGFSSGILEWQVAEAK
jgi:DUF1680 family protein